MRRISILLLAAMMIFILAGIGLAGSSEEAVTDSSVMIEETQSEENPECTADCEREMLQKQVQTQNRKQLRDGSGEGAYEGLGKLERKQLRLQLNKGNHSV